MRLSSLFPFVALAPLMTGCGTISSMFGPSEGSCVDPPAASTNNQVEEAEPGGIRPFASEAELDAYMAAIEAKYPTQSSSGCGDKNGGFASSEAAGASDNGASSSGSAPSAPSNENVTNNQEAGVDEGGIVKNIGGSLVVLRKGRLFVVDVAEGKAPTLIDSMRVARTDALNSSVWYDEMLVKGDLVYVVGYRYGVAAPGEQVRGATEVDTFRVTNGKLARLKSMFLESNDYYSGKNYASRMVDGKLVFYMPHYVGRQNGKLAYPRVLEGHDDGKFAVVGPIFGALDVFTSLYKPSYATFHTVVQCDLPETGELACHGRSVLGNWWREHYVSTDAVYLWASSHVYRFDFASLDVRAHRAEGVPVDQFSFRQSGNDLLVATNPGYSREGKPQGTAGLLKLPIPAFDKKGDQAAVPSTSFGADVSITKNRFVDDVLVAALSATGSYAYGSGAQDVVALDTKTGQASRATRPWVVRIEPLGTRRALLVSGDGGGIVLDAVGVDAVGTSLGSVALPGVSEGEGRSHGFFYKPSEGGAGRFGYAVIAPPEYGAASGWGNGISNIGFFDVAAAGSMSSLGIVSSGSSASQCETSCVDWYGNTRPIFLGARTFALMGSELAEVSLSAGAGATKGASAALTW